MVDTVFNITTANASNGESVEVIVGGQTTTGTVSGNSATVTVADGVITGGTATAQIRIPSSGATSNISLTESSSGLNITVDQAGSTLVSANPTFSFTDNDDQGINNWRYDLWFRTEPNDPFFDAGPSALTDANDITVQNSFPTDGRLLTLRIYRFVDGVPLNFNANGEPDGVPFVEFTVTAHTLSDSGSITFSQIEAAARSRHVFLEDEDYRAHALFLNPSALYATVSGTTVNFSGVPQNTRPVVNVSTVGEFQAQMNNGAGNVCVDGGGNTFTLPLPTFWNVSNVRLKNCTIRTSAGGGGDFISVNQNNVEFENVTIDMEEKAIQRVMVIYGDDFNGMVSEIKNVHTTSTNTADMISVLGNRANFRGFHWENCYGFNGPIRAVRWRNPSGTTEGGEVFNCTVNGMAAKNVHDNPNFIGDDGDSFVSQEINMSASVPLRIYAARGIDMGKRLIKFQVNNCQARSCIGEWRTLSLPSGNQTKRAIISDLGGSNNAVINCFGISQYKYTRGESIGFVFMHNRSHGSDNMKWYGNGYQINHTADTLDYGFMVQNFNGTTPRYPTNSRMQDNWIEGTGSIDHAWWDRDTPGFDNFDQFTNGDIGDILVPILRETIRNT